jgi:hypothetical protein
MFCPSKKFEKESTEVHIKDKGFKYHSSFCKGMNIVEILYFLKAYSLKGKTDPK